MTSPGIEPMREQKKGCAEGVPRYIGARRARRIFKKINFIVQVTLSPPDGACALKLKCYGGKTNPALRAGDTMCKRATRLPAPLICLLCILNTFFNDFLLCT